MNYDSLCLILNMYRNDYMDFEVESGGFYEAPRFLEERGLTVHEELSDFLCQFIIYNLVI